MNAKLRIELLTRLWNLLDSGITTATQQDLYGIPVTSRIEPIYGETLRKFLDKTLPWISYLEDCETGLITYTFPPSDECIRHMLNEVLLVNRTTLVRFILSTYCVTDPDNAIATGDLWAFILSWARKYDIAVAYLPLTQGILTQELESLGYVKCRTETGTGFWGIRING